MLDFIISLTLKVVHCDQPLKRVGAWCAAMVCVGMMNGLALATNMTLPNNWQRLSLNEAEWSVTSSPLLCRMEPSTSEEMLLNGFQQAAGESLAFFTPWKLFAPHQNTSQAYGIWALNPAWKTEKDAQWLGRAQFESAPFSVPSALASPQLTQAMLSFLDNGQQLWVQPIDINSPAKKRGYLISNVGFRLAYREFERCLAQLMPKNFQQLEKIALQYEGKNQMLSFYQQEQLREISRYMMADSAVQGIYIDGHSDSKGLRGDNLKLSEARALRVAEFLEMQGVRKDKMVVRWHGERYPVASNRSENGRKKNSRVTVRMSQLPIIYPKVAHQDAEVVNLRQDSSESFDELVTDEPQQPSKPSVTMDSSSSYTRLGPK